MGIKYQLFLIKIGDEIDDHGCESQNRPLPFCMRQAAVAAQY